MPSSSDWRPWTRLRGNWACRLVWRPFSWRPLTKVSSRFRGPFATLLKKEFRLQQIGFLLAGVFILIAVAGFCLAKRHREVASRIVGGDIFLYVLILPLIAGAISVAEEKGWGIAEWHLTLPPSALKQWSAKMLATLSTSLVLGLLLPAALFLVAAAVQPARRENLLSACSCDPGLGARPIVGDQRGGLCGLLLQEYVAGHPRRLRHPRRRRRCSLAGDMYWARHNRPRAGTVDGPASAWTHG